MPVFQVSIDMGRGLDHQLEVGRTLAQLRWVGALVVAPELAALSLLAAYRTRLSLTPGLLTFTRGAQRLELPLITLAAVRPWRWPWPSAGLRLQLSSGTAWPLGLASPGAAALARALPPPVWLPPEMGGAAERVATAWRTSRAVVLHGPQRGNLRAVVEHAP